LCTCLTICGPVTVYDQYAEMYEKHLGEFDTRYRRAFTLTYKKTDVTHPNFTPNAELAVLSHVLEHLTLKQVKRLLGNLETEKILVYGPNVAKRKGDGWFHDHAEHRTYIELDAMAELIKAAGFTKVEIKEEYNDDYIIYATR